MRSFVLAIGLSLVSLSMARAQPSTASDLPAEARPRFELATTLYAEGRYLEAAGEFQRVYELTNESAVLYNVYLSWRNAGRPRESAVALRAYLDGAREIPERAVLERQLAQLEASSASDETEPAPTSSVTPQPAVTVPVAAPSPDLAGPAILLGVGGAALLGAVVTGGLALFAHDELDETCEDGMCPESSASDLDNHRTFAITTDILWIGGTLAVGAGLVWLIAALTTERHPAPVVFGCDGQGCGGTVRGAF